MDVTLALLQGGTIDTVLEAVARQVAQIAKMDLREAVEAAREAEVLAKAVKLQRYRRIEDHAGEAQRALEGLALQASRRAGELLAGLDGGGPGRGRKSERTAIAEEAGIDGRLVRRLVELAELDDERVELVRDELLEAGKRLTVRGVLSAASKRVSVGSDEWYTPPEVAEAVHRVFGGPPDCDPASCPVAQRVIQADRYWSAAPPTLGEAEKAAGITTREFAQIKKAHAGVGQVLSWPDGTPLDPAVEGFAKAANRGRISHASDLAGKVFCNPPYAFPAPFVRAVIEGYLWHELEDEPLDEAYFEPCGRDRGAAVTEAILLVNVATGTTAGQWILDAADRICWPRGRFAFLDAHGEAQKGNRYEQLVAYFGDQPDVFAREFGPFGSITRPERSADQ